MAGTGASLVEAYLTHLTVERRLAANSVQGYARDLGLLAEFAAGRGKPVELLARADLEGFDTSPLLAVTDGDEHRDGREAQLGSDPTVGNNVMPAGALASLDVTPDSAVLTFNTIFGEASIQLSVIGTLVYLAWQGRRGPPPRLRSERLIGTTGRVTLALDPVGTVQLAEEPWTAEEEDGLTVALGERVEVLRVEGLKMIVRKVPKLLPAGEEARTGLDGEGSEG